MFYFEGNLGSDIVVHSVEEPNEFIQAGPDSEIEVAIYKGPNIKCKKGDVLWFGVDYIKKH